MFNNLNFSSSNVLVIGDIILDEYYECCVERISPEAPVMICKTNETKRTVTLGGAANVALNCRRLGAEVSLYGIAGFDLYNDEIQKLCINNNIDFFSTMNFYGQTIKKTRFRKGHNQIIRIDYENDKYPYKVSNVIYDKLIKKFHDDIEKFNAVILSDYNKGTLSEYLTANIISFCTEYNIPVFVDPKGDDWYKYAEATYVTPNFKEFKQICRTNNFIVADIDTIIHHAEAVLDDYNIDNLIITMGKDGILFINNRDNYVYLPSEAEEIFDVSGAGDTVIAAFTLAKVNNFNNEEAIKLANLAAKTVIKKIGTQAVDLEELKQEYYQHSNTWSLKIN